MGTGMGKNGLFSYVPRASAQRTFPNRATFPHSERPMPATDYFLDHERLDVYNIAREHSRESHRLLKLVPRGRADLADQYRRASLSIPLNIAEGGGEYAPAEKARFYRIAKRSATECAALLDHMVDLQMLPEPELRQITTPPCRQCVGKTDPVH
jgi:four helix bundle protein